MTAPLATAEPSVRDRYPIFSTPGAPLALGPEGRLFLLSWLHADVLSNVPITEQSWREAWGKAADYQTVVNAKAALAVTP